MRRSILGTVPVAVVLAGVCSAGLGACGNSDGGNADSTGGARSSGGGPGGSGTGGKSTATGGSLSTGGSTAPGASGGSGGRLGTGGASGGSSGGVAASGGRSAGGSTGGMADASLGGTQGTGGKGEGGGAAPDGGAGGAGGTAGRDGGAGTGGRMGTGGVSGVGGGTTTGGAGGASCVKGQTKGTDVVIIGESFIELSTIPDQIAKDAVAAGALKQGDKYINKAVSGMTLAGNNRNSIPNQYANAVQQYGTIKFVLMDGGGNDCLLNNNGDAALAAAKTLFQTMATNKTEKIQYFFYPDPVGNDRAALKSCLDALRPKMQALCEGLTSPKCYWLDLRPTWSGHNEYTSDGIHPTSAGSVATGDAIWQEMVKNCIAQ